MRWSLECGDVASGAQLAASLDWFWFALGLSNEGILRIKGFLAAAEGGDASLIAHLWTALSYLQGRIGRHKNSLESAEQAISFARAIDNRLLLVRVLTDYATAKARSHLINDAEVALKEAERIAGDTPTAWQHAILLGTRGNFERLRHEFAKAIGAYTQLRVFRRSLGDKVGEGSTVLSMAEAYHANKETDKAIALIREILEPAKLSLGRDMHANLLANIAGYLVAKDKLSDARSASCRAIQMLEASDPASAYVTWALYHLALVLALEGDSQRAAHLLGYCEHAVATVGYNVEFTERATHDRLVSLLRERCPEYQLKALRAEGEALTPRDAIHEAIPT